MLQVIITTVDVILIIRGESHYTVGQMPENAQTSDPQVYALYDRHRVLLPTLGGLFVAEVVALCCLLANVTPRLTYNDECYVTSSPPNFQYYWYAPPWRVHPTAR